MKRLLTTLVILTVCCSVDLVAQQKGPAISFDEDAHDFGIIMEADGKVTHSFDFTNTGSEALVIQNVKASCGCTTPNWTKEPVAPGGKGNVTATYNPQNRPGQFNKSITVTSNTSPATTTLRISGEVKPKPYPRSFGDLGLKTDNIGFAKISSSDVKMEKVQVVNNNQDKAISIDFENVPEYISLRPVPQSIKPGGKGVIEIVYDAKKNPSPGFKMDKLQVTINGKKEPNYILRVSATIADGEKSTPQGKSTPAEKKEVRPDKTNPNKKAGPTAASSKQNSQYSRNFEDLGLSTDHVSLGKVFVTETKNQKIQVINNSGEKTLNLTFKNIPAHLKVHASPSSLKPGEKGAIDIVYVASDKKDWGFVIDRIPVVINGDESKRYQIRVSATLEQDFSNLSKEELDNAPMIHFDETTFNFGTITQGESVSHEFKFKNTGNSNLMIHKTKASCGCTATAPTDKVIEPGAESSIKATFNSRGKKGNQNKTITVITNDPHNDGKNANITLRISGLVNVPATPEK